MCMYYVLLSQLLSKLDRLCEEGLHIQQHRQECSYVIIKSGFTVIQTARDTHKRPR